MSKDDYEAISKIVEDVLGEDTISCSKIIEGLRFYLDNKAKKARIINSKYDIPPTISLSINNRFTQSAGKAMKKYTARLNKENAKYARKNKKENCSITG